MPFRKSCNLWSVLVIASIHLASSLHGAVVELRPVADTTLIEISPDNNLGGQSFVNAGTTGVTTRNRGLFLFDLTEVISQHAIITSVDLFFEVVGIPTAGQGQFSLFGLHRVLVPWGEGDNTRTFSPGLGESADLNEATWNHRFYGTDLRWSEPGGGAGIDFQSAPSALTFVGLEDIYVFESSLDLVNDVQSWLDNPQSNFGWMLISNSEDTTFTARRFGSRENSASFPRLSIQFTPVPEPATLVFWVFGLIVLGTALRQTR